VQQKVLTAARLELQRSTQRDDQLPDRRRVPGESAARCRFLEGDAGHSKLAGQQIAALTWLELDNTFLET
jgi:hypothetical protein